MQVPSLDHRLHAGADLKRAAGIEEVSLHGAAGNPDELPYVRGEIAFAPKELKVAQDLSERLGIYTYAGRSHSRPSGLAKGHRSSTESDQRRPLMMPQELIQMAPDRLLVLRAGMPPIRGRKIVYWKERAFVRRVLPPPEVAPRALPARASAFASGNAVAGPDPMAPQTDDDLRLDLVIPALAAVGLEALPPQGASDDAVAAWVDRFIDASAQTPVMETDHGR